MGQKMFTESIEDATITLTNATASSDAKLLKNRDLRVKAIQAASGSSTIQIEFDFGAGNTRAADYVILGNLYTDADVDVDIYYWTGAAWSLDGSLAAATYANTNTYYAFSTARNAQKYRIDIDPATSAAVQLGCIFIGTEYDLPYSYDYNNNQGSFMRGEVDNDLHGYPYAHAIDTTKKRLWDVVFSLTRSDLNNIETQFQNVGYNRKAFFFYDTIIDTNYRLVWMPDNRIDPEQPGADLFKLPLQLVEL